jgi:hypothetical protein
VVADESKGGGSPYALPDDLADRWSSIVKDGLDIWVTQGRIWFDRAKAEQTWSAEDVTGDSTNLFEHLTPVAERTLDLTIDLLRPWAKAFEGRSS